MTGEWCVGSFPDLVYIAVRTDGSLPDGAFPIGPHHAAWNLRAWFPDEHHARETLISIHERVVGPVLRIPAPDLEVLRRCVAEGFESGLLRAYRLHVTLSGSGVQVDPEPPKSEPPPQEQKSWVAIKLVDDQSPPQPVPFAKYRIELPDSSIREGILDQNGGARIDGIDPGTCKVSFPQFHGPDWDPA